jgi:hypothetical protein
MRYAPVMRRVRSDKSDPERARTARLFSVLVLTGATLASALGPLGCTNSTPDPKSDAGGEGGGGHFW